MDGQRIDRTRKVFFPGSVGLGLRYEKVQWNGFTHKLPHLPEQDTGKMPVPPDGRQGCSVVEYWRK